ncbi:MAG: OmpA family protein [Candidatus Thiodiazotropha sp. (ex Lucinoma kastoroae)]|nr:OmpA family protein [Candidatus Thiodiazotropha sp. (ex Lucinoma kastoroae)]
MHIKKISLALALTPLLISSNAMAEKGLAYDSADKVWRTGYGECWTSPYRDKTPSDTSCFGEPAPAMAEGDADNDGVVDSKDQCPGTAAGVKVDEKGCALDSDGDGVVDGSDKCPDTPQGAKVDAMGCELDSDGDGVVDSKDACPNTPAGATVNAIGCAEQIVLQDVRFELNSDRISSEYVATLDHVATSLKARSDVKSVEVTGHTDSTGAADYNQSLSEKRAKAVADYLISQGVNGAIFTTNGMGESSPVADNSTAEGRAQNRRVELKLD